MSLSTAAFTGSNVRLPTRNVGFRAMAPRPVVSSPLVQSPAKDCGMSSVSISPLSMPSISGRNSSRSNVIANAAKGESDGLASRGRATCRGQGMRQGFWRSITGQIGAVGRRMQPAAALCGSGQAGHAHATVQRSMHSVA